MKLTQRRRGAKARRREEISTEEWLTKEQANRNCIYSPVIHSVVKIRSLRFCVFAASR